MFLIGIAGAAVLAAEKNTPPRAEMTAEIAAPALGFVAGDGQLRAVLGSKAFPAIGEALALPEGVKRVLVAGGQRHALVETGEGWLAVPVGGTPFAAIPVLKRQARLAALSPSGTAAVFLLQESATIVAVGGLPSAPRVAFESGVEDGVRSVAVSDDARVVLAGRAGAVLILRPNQAAGSVQAGMPSAISFVANGTRAMIADQESNQVLSLDMTDSGATVSRMAGSGEGIDAPVALAFDSHASNAVVLNRSSVVILPANGGPAHTLRCDFTPTEITPLAEHRLFGIRGGDGSGTWLLRMDAPEPVLLYVPAVGR